MQGVQVSIIIVNYNGLEHLKKCIPSLLKTEAVSFEIIIVDNGSKDDSLLWLNSNFSLGLDKNILSINKSVPKLKIPKLKIIEAQKNLGFGRANELGVSVAQGEMIAFLNNDTQVDPKWLITLFDLMANNKRITAACSKLILMEHPEILNALGGGMSKMGYGFDHFFGFSRAHQVISPKQNFPPLYSSIPAHSSISVHSSIPVCSSIPVFFPTAAAMLISKKTFLNLGGFDKSFFMYHEDVDLGWRIWLSGGEVHVSPDSIVYHCFGGTTSVVHGNGWRDRLGMRHNIRSIIKCYRKQNVISILRAHLRLWRQRKAWKEMAHVIWWNILRLPSTLLERFKIQRKRIPSDEELIMKGILSDSDFPAISPQIPKSTKKKIIDYTVKSSSLFMGDDGAIGRLGTGWYFVENIDNKKARWNNGYSKCWLKVKPKCSGVLRVTLLLPTPSINRKEGVWVKIISNALEHGDSERVSSNNSNLIVENNSKLVSEKLFEFQDNFGWHHLEINSQADSEGVIEIEIVSSTWSPHTLFNNQDHRILGCAVEMLEFIESKSHIASKHPKSKFDRLDGSDLTVIIPTYNRKEVLEQALEALQNQTLHGFEVIVVDDGSTDGTFDFLKEWKELNDFNVESHNLESHNLNLESHNLDLESHNLNFNLILLWQENQKQGRARNYGLQFATGKIVMFIGDDILLEPDCLEVHMKMHNTNIYKTVNTNGIINSYNNIAIVGFTDWDRKKMRVSPFLDFINSFGAQFGYKLMKPGEEVPFTCFYTSHISMHRSVLGYEPFDSSFKEYGWEDIDLGYRLCQQGLKIMYIPEAKAWHFHPTDVISFLNRQKKVGFAIETLLKRHPELRYSNYLPTFTPSWTFVLASPIWDNFIKCINFLDQKSKVQLPSTLYHWLISYPFHNGWDKRIRCLNLKS